MSKHQDPVQLRAALNRRRDPGLGAAVREEDRRIRHTFRCERKEFYHAVDQDAQVSSRLLDLLVTTASPRNRKVETVKARVRAARGLGS